MKTLVGLLLVGLLSGLLLAQAPPAAPTAVQHAQHRVKFLTTLLSLNSGQQQQALTIFTNAANAEANLHQSMRTAHEALNTAAKNNDTSAIEQAAATIGQLSGQMAAIHGKAQAALNQILTPEQQSKLSELETMHPGHGMGMFHMGHPGPAPADH